MKGKRAGLRFLLPLALLLGTTACFDDPPRPRSGPGGVYRRGDPDPPPRRERAPIVDARGRLNLDRFRGEIRSLEDALYRNGPTTIPALEEAWDRAERLRSAIRMKGFMEKEPRVRKGLDDAEEAVRELRHELLVAIAHWDEESTLTRLRPRWERVRSRHFPRADWMRRSDRDLDKAQSERDPPTWGNLRNIIDELQAIADDCEILDEWTYEYVGEIQQAIGHRRMRPGRKLRLREVVIPYRDPDSKGPRDLLKVYEILDGLRVLLNVETGTYFWMDGDRAGRLSDVMNRDLDRARRLLDELQV